MKTVPELIACAQREAKMRRSAYPKWVANGRMSAGAMAHEIECMDEIIRVLQGFAPAAPADLFDVTPAQASPPSSGPGSNTGHGHVWDRPDGMRARCGGPAMCSECARDAGRFGRPGQRP